MDTISQNNRPRLEMLRARSNMDWGEAPKYNEAYRKIRWPGLTSDPIHYRPLTDAERQLIREATPLGRLRETMDYPLQGHVETETPIEGVTITRRYRRKPMWKDLIRHQRDMKDRGRWTRNQIRKALTNDILHCMKENIPFKTKSIEYKPSTQWVYVYGVPVMRYNLVTGCISAITYGGVYHKVTSLVFRMFGIKIRLHGRKLKWSHTSMENGRPGINVNALNQVPIAETVDIDLNKVYTYQDFYPATAEWKGFYQVSYHLFNEFTRSLTADTQ